jgi:actin cytoskeleton-regulatory complex protein PAN1
MTLGNGNYVLSFHSIRLLTLLLLLVKAKALYSYDASNPDELPFAEGDELIIVDQSEREWWKVEQAGMIFLVPAAYLEVVEG